MNAFKLAWINCQYGVNNFGGSKKDYFSESLKLAKKGINLFSVQAKKEYFKTELIFNLLTVLSVVAVTLLILCDSVQAVPAYKTLVSVVTSIAGVGIAHLLTKKQVNKKF